MLFWDDISWLTKRKNKMSHFVEKATSHMQPGPDWAMNMEICYSIINDPGPTKDHALKTVKKRLQNKNPRVQFLTLIVLENMIKICGDIVRQEVIDRKILSQLVKIVKKQKNAQVTDKILHLLDSWQEEFGGPMGRYSHYFMAYAKLQKLGFMFSKPTENAPLIFTTPQTVSISAWSASPPQYEVSSEADAGDLRSPHPAETTTPLKPPLYEKKMSLPSLPIGSAQVSDDAIRYHDLSPGQGKNCHQPSFINAGSMPLLNYDALISQPLGLLYPPQSYSLPNSEDTCYSSPVKPQQNLVSPQLFSPPIYNDLLPPPTLLYGNSMQFSTTQRGYEQQKILRGQFGPSSPYSSSSYSGGMNLAGQMQNPSQTIMVKYSNQYVRKSSFGRSNFLKEDKPEETLFKDLVDFGEMKYIFPSKQ